MYCTHMRHETLHVHSTIHSYMYLYTHSKGHITTLYMYVCNVYIHHSCSSTYKSMNFTASVNFERSCLLLFTLKWKTENTQPAKFRKIECQTLKSLIRYSTLTFPLPFDKQWKEEHVVCTMQMLFVI